MPLPEKLDRPEILQLLFYPRRTGRTAPPDGARDIDIRVDDQAVIGCRLFTADPAAPVILFFHGNGETVPDYDDIGPRYTALNLNFLIVDYRGYGWSSGTPLASTIITDGHVLYKELRQWLTAGGFSGPLFIMGRSLGSANAIDLAAAYQEEVGGLIIESGFAGTIALARTLGVDLERLGLTEEDCFNNLAKIKATTLPTLLMHGQRDALIPLRHAEELHSASSARAKELQVIPGADHNTMIMMGGSLYFETIRRFIDKVTGANTWRQNRKQRQKSGPHLNTEQT